MKAFILLFALLYCTSGHSQSQGKPLVDSLLMKIPEAANDTIKVRLFLRVSDLYIDIDQQKALLYADSSILASKRMNWERGVAGGMLAYANVYNFTGNADKAVDFLKQAIVVYKKIDYKYGLGASLNALGKSYEALSNYPSALQCFVEALKIHESIPKNDFNIAISLSGMANIFYLQRDYKKSLEYSFKALQKKEAINNRTSIANELYAIGDTYFEMGDSINSGKYNLRALQMFTELQNKMGEANVYSNLGKLFRKDYAKSLSYFYRAKNIFEELKEKSPSYFLMEGQIGSVFFDMAKFGDTLSNEFKSKYNIPRTRVELLSQAESYMQKAISVSMENEDKENEYLFSGEIAELQSLQNDYKNAFFNFKKFHFLQDSLYSQENKNKIASIEGEREIAIRDKEIVINKLALSNQRKTQIGLLMGLVLLSIIGGLLYLRAHTRKKTNTTLMVLNSELDEANKIKTKFFGILSHDLRSPVANLVSYLHLQQQAPDLLNKESTEKHTKKITASAEQLLENMEGLLLWSKGQMENFKPSKKKVEVSQLFSEMNILFAETKNVKIVFDNRNLVSLITDEDYLKTIMRNLTTNAIKAIEKVENATIEWKAWEESGKQYLSITDNGPGVSPDHLMTLTNKNSSVGIKSGLGLHLVRDMANAIACTISVKSEPGKGTSFQLAI